MNKVIEKIRNYYYHSYSKHGIKPTRVVLGIDVFNAVRLETQQRPILNGVRTEHDGKLTCFGLPVTIDMLNPNLIYVGVGEDYTLELEGDKE